MVTPNPAPNDGRPADIEESSDASPVTNQDAARQADPADTPRTTQSELAGSDGAGIRGNYGDAEQTTGLEGGTTEPADATPDRAGHNPTADTDAGGQVV